MNVKASHSFIAFLSIYLSALILVGFTIMGTSGPWTAPESANAIKNPLKGNTDATNEGKKLFRSYCEMCHGEKGKGDGIAGVNLDPKPTNLTLQAVQDQTDGAIFWKLATGRPPMAAYKDILTEKQRWQLVNYIRELGQNTH